MIYCIKNSLSFRCFSGGGAFSYLALHDGPLCIPPQQTMVLGVLHQNPSNDILV